MTPRQARAARAMLGLDMKSVCGLANVGKRTLAEFEAGTRGINSVTEGKLKAFYISRGVLFAGSEGREGISLSDISESKDELYTQVRDMAEYRDIFSATDIIGAICEINEIIKSIDDRLSISQSIMIELMRITKFNQKQLSEQLNCSPSFINAIVVGQKSLPLSYAAYVQKALQLYGIDIENALRQEKIIVQLAKQIKALQKEYLAAWRQIHG